MTRSGPVPSLTRNAAWTVAGNVVYAGCQLGALIAIAKLGNAEQLGRFALALAIASPATQLCMLQLRSLQVTDVTDRTPFSEYLGLRLVGMAVALVVIAGIAAVGYSGQTAWAIVAVGVAKSIEALSDVGFGLLQRHERMRQVAISQIAKGVLSVAAIAAAIHVTGSAALAGVALAGAWLVTLVAIDLPAVRALHGSLRPSLAIVRLRSLTWIALPLGVVTAMLALVHAIPRLMLEGSGTLDDVGVFAALLTMILPGTIVASAIGQAASPRLATAFARGDRAAIARIVTRLTAASLAIGVGAFAIVALWGPSLLRLLYSEQIAQHAAELPLVMVAGGLWCLTSVAGYTATAAKKLAPQPIATGASVVATLLAASWLVPEHGLSGAVISALVSAAVILPAYITLLLIGDRRDR